MIKNANDGEMKYYQSNTFAAAFELLNDNCDAAKFESMDEFTVLLNLK